MEFSDQQLIEQYLRSGEEQPLEILIGRHLKAVYNFVLHYVRDPATAEDVTQEVFLKVWKNLKRFDTKKNFKTWILSIARNSSIDYLRKKQTLNFSAFEGEDQSNPIVDNLADPEPLPQDLLKSKEFLTEFEQALLKLPEAVRVVLLMHLNEDLTFKEMAETLKQPLDTVKSRYRRGLISLRKILEYKQANSLSAEYESNIGKI